jgi:hypothetical protein
VKTCQTIHAPFHRGFFLSAAELSFGPHAVHILFSFQPNSHYATKVFRENVQDSSRAGEFLFRIQSFALWNARPPSRRWPKSLFLSLHRVRKPNQNFSRGGDSPRNDRYERALISAPLVLLSIPIRRDLNASTLQQE